MSRTVVEITPRGEGVACALSGELVIPRLVRRRGRAVEVALVAGRAMLLPGDDVRIDIRVGAGCTLALIDIGGLVVYGREGESDAASQWHARIELADDAHLTWDGLPTVVSDAGRLVRSLTAVLGAEASAAVRETLVLGRTGEVGGRLTSQSAVADSGGPILREELDVRGDERVPGILGTTRVMDSILTLGAREPAPAPTGVALLELERGGTLLRYLGDAAHESPLAGFRLEGTAHDREPARVG